MQAIVTDRVFHAGLASLAIVVTTATVLRLSFPSPTLAVNPSQPQILKVVQLGQTP